MTTQLLAKTYQKISNPKYGLQLMRNQYILDDIVLGIQQ